MTLDDRFCYFVVALILAALCGASINGHMPFLAAFLALASLGVFLQAARP